MTIDRLESASTKLTPEEINFDNYSTLHGLSVVISELDTLRRDELLAKLGQFRLRPFIAPTGHDIVVEPFSKKSREVPLALEKREYPNPAWIPIPPASGEYRRSVRYHNEFDEYFIGEALGQDNGQMHVYQFGSRTPTSKRVLINHQTRFKLVSRPSEPF